MSKWFEEPKFKIADAGTSNAKEAIAKGIAEVALEAKKGFCEQIVGLKDTGARPAVLNLYFDSGRIGGSNALEHVQSVIWLIKEELRSKVLTVKNIPYRWKIETTFLSDEGKQKVSRNKREDTANVIAMFSVYNLALLASIFGEYFLSEEHKKGTFMLLLLSPTSKTSVLAANFLATFVVTGAMFIPNYLSLLLVMHSGPADFSTATLLTTWNKTVAPSMIATLPLIIMASSLAVLASTFLRNKGQKAMFTGLLIGTMECLAAAIFLPHYLVNKFITFVPISGSTFVLRDAILGFHNFAPVAISITVSLTASFCLLALSAWRLNSKGALEWIMRS
jgi:ABC-type transport system involved in multi-copper enzyme maturation permease subunit